MTGTILAIASGKGGVGKTWFAITLAHLLSRMKRKVLLFDGDIGLANLDVQLGLTPRHDLSEVFFAGAKLQDVITEYAPNFDIIAGRSGTGNLATLPADTLASLKDQLWGFTSTYDYVIIDLGAGVEEHVRALAAFASRCIVVVTDEPTSLTDAYAFIKLLIGGKVKDKLKNMAVSIVVNQAQTLKEGNHIYEKLDKACVGFLKFLPDLLGVIRKDGKVRESIRSQTSLITLAPHCTAASDAASIAIKLMQK